ncbi:MAG TPA: MBL fold metallo-hydrolase [Desulfobulbaceae bacterium]|nr:MBL fold metallo-hydrolase [Desulfobulbaceae bacterium]
MIPIHSYDNGVYAIDAQYEQPLRAAIHFILDHGHAAVIDTAHNPSVGLALQAIAQLGLKREDVDYICLTHVHLDHAGGAGAYMREFGQAKLIVHPRGARHMIDPSQLMAGVKAIYGEAETKRLYGDVLPVPAERVIAANDETPLALGNRQLLCLDTPGHARHHLCYYDLAAKVVFTGDVFGLSYRELDVDGRQSVIVTSSPVQFDPRAMHGSIRRILALQPKALYLTHFSQLRQPEARGDDVHRLIDAYVAIAEQAGPDEEGRCQRIADGLWRLYDAEARRQGWTLPRQQMRAILRLDTELNAKGLDVWLKTKRRNDHVTLFHDGDSQRDAGNAGGFAGAAVNGG